MRPHSFTFFSEHFITINHNIPLGTDEFELFLSVIFFFVLGVCWNRERDFCSWRSIPISGQLGDAGIHIKERQWRWRRRRLIHWGGNKFDDAVGHDDTHSSSETSKCLPKSTEWINWWFGAQSIYIKRWRRTERHRSPNPKWNWSRLAPGLSHSAASSARNTIMQVWMVWYWRYCWWCWW